MHKKINIFALLLLFFAFFGFCLYLLPYHYIFTIISEGGETILGDFGENREELLNGKVFSDEDLNGQIEEERIWKTFHFSLFKIPFPIKHPIYHFLPIIKKTRKGHLLGVKLTDINYKPRVEIIQNGQYSFDLKLNHQIIFKLPYFRKYILKKGISKIYRDLFLMKLSEFLIEKSFFKSLQHLKLYDFRELVYKIYILHLRKEYFPQNLSSIKYNKDKDFGILKFKHGGKFNKEEIHLMRNGIIFKMILKTKKANVNAALYRKRFFSKFTFKQDSENDAVKIFSEFKSLKYNRSIDQIGLVYLFSAWSHDITNKNYLIKMIHLLERGKVNVKNLAALYEFSYKKYGTNFSSIEDRLLENSKTKLKRLIAEELAAEINAEKSKVDKTQDDLFDSAEKKIEYYLKNAKKHNLDLDSEENTLTVE